MSEYDEELKSIIRRYMKKRGRDDAFRRLKRKLSSSAKFFDEAAEKKQKLYRDCINEVIAREIAVLRASADQDWERVKALDALKDSGWEPDTVK